MVFHLSQTIDDPEHEGHKDEWLQVIVPTETVKEAVPGSVKFRENKPDPIDRHVWLKQVKIGPNAIKVRPVK
jgi:hypothetical protein